MAQRLRLVVLQLLRLPVANALRQLPASVVLQQPHAVLQQPHVVLLQHPVARLPPLAARLHHVHRVHRLHAHPIRMAAAVHPVAVHARAAVTEAVHAPAADTVQVAVLAAVHVLAAVVIVPAAEEDVRPHVDKRWFIG